MGFVKILSNTHLLQPKTGTPSLLNSIAIKCSNLCVQHTSNSSLSKILLPNMTLAAIDLWSTPRFAELLSVKAPGDASRFLSASSFAEFSETLLLENKRLKKFLIKIRKFNNQIEFSRNINDLICIILRHEMKIFKVRLT